MHPRIMCPVGVPHSSERHVTQARPENMSLGAQCRMQDLTGAIRSLVSGMAAEPDGVSVELFEITLYGDPALHRRLLDIVVCLYFEGGEVPQQWKYAIIMVLHISGLFECVF